MDGHNYKEAEEMYACALMGMAKEPRLSLVAWGMAITGLGVTEKRMGRTELALSLLEEVIEMPNADTIMNPVMLDVSLSTVMELRDGVNDVEGALSAARRWLAIEPQQHRSRARIERAAMDLEQALDVR
jgi:hypothetical protein